MGAGKLNFDCYSRRVPEAPAAVALSIEQQPCPAYSLELVDTDGDGVVRYDEAASARERIQAILRALPIEQQCAPSTSTIDATCFGHAGSGDSITASSHQAWVTCELKRLTTSCRAAVCARPSSP